MQAEGVSRPPITARRGERGDLAVMWLTFVADPLLIESVRRALRCSAPTADTPVGGYDSEAGAWWAAAFAWPIIHPMLEDAGVPVLAVDHAHTHR